MSSTVFKIMIHGLIALAPSDSNDPNHVTALVLDTGMHHEAQCLSQHVPKITFVPDEPAHCDIAECESHENQCVCTTTLSGKDVWLEISPIAAMVSEKLPSDDDKTLANNHGLPANKIAAGSILYVANMTKPPFDMELHPGYLLPNPKSANLQNLYARMKIPFQSLTACSLSKREDQGDAYIQSMSFRKLHDKGKSTDRSQALAQMVVARFEIPDDQTVALHMKNFDNNLEDISIPLRNSNGYLIDLSNEPKETLRYGDACDDGIARHFPLFYEFAKTPPAPDVRLTAHVRFLNSIKATDLVNDNCKDLHFTAVDRPICPMASFIP